MEAAPDSLDYSLLPKDKAFGQSVVPFVLPYFAYVAIGAMPARLLDPGVTGVLRLLAVAGLLLFFRKDYKFGPSFAWRHVPVTLGAGVLASVLWIFSLRFCLSLPFWSPHLQEASAAHPTFLYWVARALSSTFLVAIFEELFCRVYLMEFFRLDKNAYEGGTSGPRQPARESLAARLGRRWDEHPDRLERPPLGRSSVIGSGLIFALGHDTSAWIPAILFFGVTTWVYAKTQSFRVCMAVHGLTNLALAVLVLFSADMRFLWF